MFELTNWLDSEMSWIFDESLSFRRSSLQQKQKKHFTLEAFNSGRWQRGYFPTCLSKLIWFRMLFKGMREGSNLWHCHISGNYNFWHNHKGDWCVCVILRNKSCIISYYFFKFLLGYDSKRKSLPSFFLSK